MIELKQKLHQKTGLDWANTDTSKLESWGENCGYIVDVTAGGKFLLTIDWIFNGHSELFTSIDDVIEAILENEK